MAYRNYVADAIKIITENTATDERRYLTMRFYDILHGKKPEEEEDAQSIIDRIRRKVEET